MSLGGGNLVRIQLEVIADKEIEVTVPVIIEKSTACAPTNLCLVEAGLVRDIGERAISIVVKENVVSPEAAKQGRPIRRCRNRLRRRRSANPCAQSRFFRDIGKRAIAVVFVEMRRRRFSWRPMRIEPISVGEVDVQPSVIVVIEKGQSASLGLDDGPFVVDAAPHVGACSARLAGATSTNWTPDGVGFDDCRFDDERFFPFPQRSGKCIRQRTAEHEERGPKEAPSREDHRWR